MSSAPGGRRSQHGARIFVVFSRALFERGIVDSERFFENIGESAKDIGGKLGQLVSNGSNRS